MNKYSPCNSECYFLSFVSQFLSTSFLSPLQIPFPWFLITNPNIRSWNCNQPFVQFLFPRTMRLLWRLDGNQMKCCHVTWVQVTDCCDNGSSSFHGTESGKQSSEEPATSCRKRANGDEQACVLATRQKRPEEEEEATRSSSRNK